MPRNIYDARYVSKASYEKSTIMEGIIQPGEHIPKVYLQQDPSHWLKDLQHNIMQVRFLQQKMFHFVTGGKFCRITFLLQLLDNSFKAAKEWELANQCPNLSKAQSLPDKYKQGWQG